MFIKQEASVSGFGSYFMNQHALMFNISTKLIKKQRKVIYDSNSFLAHFTNLDFFVFPPFKVTEENIDPEIVL